MRDQESYISFCDSFFASEEGWNEHIVTHCVVLFGCLFLEYSNVVGSTDSLVWTDRCSLNVGVVMAKS